MRARCCRHQILFVCVTVALRSTRLGSIGSSVQTIGDDSVALTEASVSEALVRGWLLVHPHARCTRLLAWRPSVCVLGLTHRLL